MRARRIVRLVSVAAVATAVLAGCAPGVPAVQPTAAASSRAVESAPPTRTPTPAPAVPGFILVTASSVSVVATDSRVIVDIPYSTTAATAAVMVESSIGAAPVVTAFPQDPCNAPRTEYDWGGLSLSTPVGRLEPPGVLFTAYLTGPETRNGLAIKTLGGQQVGASVDVFLASVPGSVLLGGFVYFDVKSGVPGVNGGWGANARVNHGVIDDVETPALFNSGC